MLIRSLFALLALGTVGLIAPSTPRALATRPADGATIEGTVTLHQRPPERVTGHYPGAAPTPHAVQSLNAIAFIRGKIDGAPPVPPTAVPTMTQHDTAFVPGTLAIPVGTAVSFPNDDPFFHNVFSYSRTKRFDLGRYPKGTAKRVTFNEPGVVKVYCEVHNFMRAVILVTENPFFTVIPDDGHFRIEGVPPGEYTLDVWQPDLGTVEQHIVVPASGVVHVHMELG